MDSELRRLATFSDWSGGTNCNNSCPLILARLGFKYIGCDDRVVCCHCETEVQGWNTSDDVKTKHGSCLQHFERSNEMPSIINDVRHRLPTSYRAGRSSPTTVPNTGDVRDSNTLNDNPTTSTLVKSNLPFYEVCEATLCRASRKNFSDIYNRSAVSADGSVPADIIIDRLRPDFELLKVESVRFKTFHDWPERAARIVEPRDLARAGMFYTGQIDRVQCAFCHGYLRNWVQGDKPAEEHRKNFPNCLFVQGDDVGTLDHVDNTPFPNQVFAPFQQPEV